MMMNGNMMGDNLLNIKALNLNIEVLKHICSQFKAPQVIYQGKINQKPHLNKVFAPKRKRKV